MSRDVTAIVLAGGRSTRFGEDKLAHHIEGVSILDRAIRLVAEVAPEVLVVGSAHELPAFAGAELCKVEDPDPHGGPLQALAGALAATRTPRAIVVAGDMPSLVPAVLSALLDAVRSAPAVDAAILADPGAPARRQPLPLAIRVEPARAAAAAALGVGDRSLVRLLDRLGVVELPVERWLPFDPEARTLVDIDLPDDLDRVDPGAFDRRLR